MKLKELTGEFEKRRAICYKADGYSVTYHNKEMQRVDGNLYRGQTEQENSYTSCCMLYVCYPEQKTAMEIGKVNVDYSVEKTVEICKRQRLDTQEAFVEKIRRLIENQEHIQLIWVEYLKYMNPSLIDACMESRKIFANKREQIEKEWREQREAKNQKFVTERNAEAEKTVADAIEIIRNGGTLKNDNVVFYRSPYDSSHYSIVNYLMRKNGVNVPVRTQGWINEKLTHVEIFKDNKISIRFRKAKNGKCSEKFFQYMFELIRIIRAENQ